MVLMCYKKLEFPLPPAWEKSEDWVDEAGNIYSSAQLPQNGVFRPNIVVTSEENSMGETVGSFSQRKLTELQSQLTNFQNKHSGHFYHCFLSVYYRKYNLEISSPDGARLRLTQIQHYISLDQEIYSITMSDLESHFDRLEPFSNIMITRLRVRKDAV